METIIYAYFFAIITKMLHFNLKPKVPHNVRPEVRYDILTLCKTIREWLV